MRKFAIFLIITCGSQAWSASQNCLALGRATRGVDGGVAWAMSVYKALGLRNDKAATLESELRKKLNSPSVEDRYCSRMAKYMTDSDMASVAAFFRSPAGQKFTQYFSVMEIEGNFLIRDAIREQSREFAAKGFPAFPE